MLSLPQFFSCPHDEALQEQINSYTPLLTFDEPICMLLGPEKSGKTSLLFQYAYNYAAASDLPNPVYFICSKQKISNQLPRFPPNFEPNPEILRRIKMKYLETDEALCYFLSSVQLFHQPPPLMFIDDLSSFVSARPPTQALAKILAFIKDTSDFLIRTTNAFTVILSESLSFVDAHPQILEKVYERWIPLTLTIKGPSSPYSLSVLRASGKPDAMGRIIYYAIDNQALSMLDIGQQEAEQEDTRVKMEGTFPETEPDYKHRHY